MIYDLIVIGAGSAGLACARRAASYGKKVCVIESQDIGGTCVNNGCIPKKMLFYAADIMTNMNKYSKFYSIYQNDNGKKGKTEGIFDWTEFVENKDKAIKRLNDIFHGHLQKANIEFISSKGYLIHSEENAKISKVMTEDGKILEGDNILISTGSSPILPYEKALSSDDFFWKIKNKPRKIVFVGSGYIGVELSSAVAELGVEVHLIIRNNIVLSNFDEMISSIVTNNIENSGIHLHKNTAITDHSGSKVTLNNGTVIEEVDHVIWAIGRKPNLDFLKNYSSYEEIKKIGKIEILKNFNCPQIGENVFALGDVVGKVMLTPYAIKCGRKLADKLFKDNEKDFKFEEPKYIPTVVFSHPPCGVVGYTEKEARKLFKEVVVKTDKFDGLFYNIPKVANIDSKDIGGCAIKVIYEKESEEVIGIHLIGNFSAEALQGFALAMTVGVTYKDFKDCLAIHPTSAEDVILI